MTDDEIVPRDTRVLSETQIAEIWPMKSGARLCVGPRDSMYYDNEWHYPSLKAAMKALADWEPVVESEPPGWERHPLSGRYRPQGDPAREYRKL